MLALTDELSVRFVKHLMLSVLEMGTANMFPEAIQDSGAVHILFRLFPEGNPVDGT